MYAVWVWTMPEDTPGMLSALGRRLSSVSPLQCASRRDLIFSFAGSIPYTGKSDSISLKHFSWNQGAQLLRYEWEEDGGRGAEMSCLFTDPVDSQRTVIQQEYLWHNLIGLEGGHLCLVEVQFACMMYDVTHFMGNWVTVFVREKLPSLPTHPPLCSPSTHSEKDKPHPWHGMMPEMG